MRLKKLLKCFFFLILFGLGIFGFIYFMKSQPTVIFDRIANLAHAFVRIGLLMSVAWLIIKFIEVVYWQWLFVLHSGKMPPKLLKDLVKVIILLLVLFLILNSILDVSLTGFIATSGVIGLTLGFALKNVLADLFNGIILHLDLPFRVGDYIFLHDRQLNCPGTVLEVNWRTTLLQADDGTIYVVPNRKVCAIPLTNYSKKKLCLETLELVLDPNLPCRRALAILTAAARSANGVSHHEPAIARVVNMTEAGISYAIDFFCAVDPIQRDLAKNAIYQNIYQHLALAGVAVGIPQHIQYVQEYTKTTHDMQAKPVDLLGVNALFGCLTKTQQQLIAEQMKRRVYEEHDVILHEGAEGTTMFIIVEGLVDVVVNVPEQESQRSVCKLAMGDFFGEMSLFTGEPRSATIIAETEVVLFEIPKEALLTVFAASPELMEKLADIVTTRQLNDKQFLEKLQYESQTAQKNNFMLSLMEKMRVFFYNA